MRDEHWAGTLRRLLGRGGTEYTVAISQRYHSVRLVLPGTDTGAGTLGRQPAREAPALPSLGQLWVRGMLIGLIRVNERRHVEGVDVSFRPWVDADVRRASELVHRGSPCVLRAARFLVPASGWALALGAGNKGVEILRGWCSPSPSVRLRCQAGNKNGNGRVGTSRLGQRWREPGQASRRQRGETGEDADTGQASASRWRSLALAYCHGTLLRCRRPRPRSCALVNLAARRPWQDGFVITASVAA